MIRFRLGKIPITMRFSFLFVLGLYLAAQRLWGTRILLAVLIHELGHLLILLLQGQSPERLELSAAGILMVRGKVGSFGQELLLHLGGPLANLAMVGLLWQRDQFACAAHLILAAVNLLPLEPLDGGSVTELLLEQLVPPERVTRLCRLISAATLAVLLAAALPLFFHGRNPSLLLFVLLLAMGKRE